MPNPEGALPGRSRRTQILCLGCREWFTADNFSCPNCGRERPGYNPHIRVEKLNRHTHQMAQFAKENH